MERSIQSYVLLVKFIFINYNKVPLSPYFLGLPANHLLQKYSYRKVGLMGACIFFIGTFGTIFVTNLFQMIISFGVLQGILAQDI